LSAVSQLRVEDIAVGFGPVRILRGVTLEVAPGEAVGIVGPNGSGKTTLLDVISGLVPPSRGRVLFGGRDITWDAPHVRARLGMARTFQHGRLYPSLTVREAIAVGCRVAGHGRRARAEAEQRALDVADAFGLASYENAFISELSTGVRRILDLAIAAARGCGVMLLDEPTAGLAHGERTALLGVFRSWRERTGCSLLVVEHDLAFLTNVVDRVIALDEGVVSAERTPKDALAAAREVVASMLGERHVRDGNPEGDRTEP